MSIRSTYPLYYVYVDDKHTPFTAVWEQRAIYNLCHAPWEVERHTARSFPTYASDANRLFRWYPMFLYILDDDARCQGVIQQFPHQVYATATFRFYYSPCAARCQSFDPIESLRTRSLLVDSLMNLQTHIRRHNPLSHMNCRIYYSVMIPKQYHGTCHYVSSRDGYIIIMSSIHLTQVCEMFMFITEEYNIPWNLLRVGVIVAPFEYYAPLYAQ